VADEGIRYGWHFLPADGKMASYNGSRRTTVKVGGVYAVKGEIFVCRNGLHGSTDPLVSLDYAPGAVVTWCKFTGPFSDDTDGKFAARSREVIAMADVTRELHEFGLWAARRAMLRERKAGREPDKRSWDALAIKRRWLDGKTTDSELAAAKDAASAAAWDASRAPSRDAACAAASDAAFAAASDAASTAARAAKRAAAGDAKRAAAWDAERTHQRKILTASLNRALGLL